MPPIFLTLISADSIYMLAAARGGRRGCTAGPSPTMGDSSRLPPGWRRETPVSRSATGPSRPVDRIRRGFSLAEILVAMIFMMVALAALFGFFSSSSRNSLDACRETYARSLAQEALEWVSGLGYEQLARIASSPTNIVSTRLGLGAFVPIERVQLDEGALLEYPPDYRQFERRIELDHFANERLCRLRVTVRPRQDFSLRRGAIVLEKLVGAEHE